MSPSELITSLHRQRKAIIYIRQSTPYQVLTNQESTRLQYALQQRAQSLGWRAQDIEIIDAGEVRVITLHQCIETERSVFSEDYLAEKEVAQGVVTHCLDNRCGAD